MQLEVIQSKIYEVRNQKVMLDFDLSEMFEIETKALNQAVKRNSDRFPKDFMFRLSPDEWQMMRSQIVTASPDRRNTKATPFAFSEHGVTMLASVLRSERAVQMNIAIVRAFVAMRQIAGHYDEMITIIAELEQKMNHKFKDVWQALNFLLDRREEQGEWEDRTLIGFKRKE